MLIEDYNISEVAKLMNFHNEREALAWCAGFFEGEGSFSRYKSRKRNDGTQLVYLIADVGQKSEALLEVFRDTVGFGSIYSHKSDNMHHWKTTKKGEAARLLGLFEGMLSERRLTTAALILLEEEESLLHPRIAWNKGTGQIPECGHPEKRYKAIGLCEPCYQRTYYQSIKKGSTNVPR